MPRLLKNLLLVLAISIDLTSAKTECQKIFDGEESDDVSVEQINGCYGCKGWYPITEGEVTSDGLLAAELDEGDTNGWFWCASPENDAFEVTFQRPIKIAGFTLISALKDTWVKTLFVSYRDDENVEANAKDYDRNTPIFRGNSDDYAEKKNKFLVPIETQSLRVYNFTYEGQACFKIQLYSCDKQRPTGDNALSDAAPYQSTGTSDCLIDVNTDCPESDKCLQHVKDSDGCDLCDCDVYYTGMKEGDIIVDTLSREMVEVAYGIKKDPYNLMRGGLKGDRNRWNDYRSGNNYIVPYILEGSLSSTGRRVIPQAMAAIESATCMRFRPRTNQQYFLKFFRGRGCYSYVGNIRANGGQQISIGSGCEHTGIVQHEILHALGFWHEQSRSDRDRYVKIFYENIVRGRENNFEKRDTEDFGSPYDYKSVMHYSNRAFSSNGKNTIEAIGNPSLSLGQRDGLSTEDKIQVNRMYQCRGTTSSTASPSTTTRTTTRRTTTTDPTGCKDTRPTWACAYWKGRGYCTKDFVSFMEKYCTKTCGKCGGSCKDTKSYCPRIKSLCNSRSRRHRERMLERCPKTCDVC